MFSKNKKTLKSKTSNSRLQQSVSHLTSDPNFQLFGVSPLVRFRSPGHGSAHGLAPVNDDEEDDYPVEEVSLVKPKKPSRRAARAKKDDPKEPSKDWTIAEEIALCQAWCDVSKNNIVGNSMKTRGFGMLLLRTLKIKLVHQEGRKKSKTSETTSGSASGDFNLHDEADELWKRLRSSEKNNETLIALTPILSVEDKSYEVVSSGWSFISAVPGTISSIPIGGNISLEGFLLPIMLVVVINVTVVIVAVILIVVIVAIVGVVIVVTIIGVVVVIGVFAIIKLSFVIIGFEVVTFPSILLGNPSMKTSISFSEFGTIVGHKVANSWNLLILGDLVGLLYSNRFGIGIPPGQGILGESTSSKFTLQSSKILESKTSRDGNGDNEMRDPIGGLVSLGSSGSGSSPRGRVNLTGDEDPIDEDGDTRLVHGLVVTLYYCKVGTQLKLGIKIIKTDSDVDEFVNFGYRNKWQVNLYVEHSGYDALDIKDQEETMADDEVDDNVIIKNVTTNDPFLNKLCPDSAHFLNVVDEPVFANDETVVEDSENIDPKFSVKSGVTYIRHEPNHNWKKMELVLGIRDVEAGRCVGCKKEPVSKPPKVPRPPALRTAYGTHASARVRGRGSRGGRGAFGGRGEGSKNKGESSTTGCHKEEGEGDRKIDYYHPSNWTQKEESFDHEPGEKGFRLGDYEAKELGKKLAEPIVAVTPSAEPIASATHSIDKGKQVAEPQKVRFLVFLDGLETYLLKTLEDGPFIPMLSMSTFDNPLPKGKNQWSSAESRLDNQDKRLKSIIISFLPNDVMKSVIKCKTTKEIWYDLIFTHKGPSDTKDTKIAALRQFNAFKSLEGEKVNETFTRLKCLLIDLKNNGVIIPQAEVNATFVNNLPRKWLSMNQTQRSNNSIKNDILASLYGRYNYEKGLIDQIYEQETQKLNIQASSSKALIFNNNLQDSDSDVEEDQRTNNEFMGDLNVEYHERALLDYKGKYKGLKAEMVVLTKRIDDLTKGKREKGKNKTGKSDKGLIAESFGWNKESVSSEDKETTKIKAFMAIAKDEPSVRKADSRSSQWVEIKMKKVHRLLSMTKGDERKHVLDYTHVDLYYLEDQRKNLVNKFNLLKQELSLHKSELCNLKNIVSINCSLQNETCSKFTLDQLLSEQVPSNIVKALGGRGRIKENIYSKEVIFTKADESSSMSIPKITSESECKTQEPLSPLPKLIGAELADTSNCLISLADLTLNMADLTLNTSVSKKTKPTFDKVSPTYAIKKKTKTKSSTVPALIFEKKSKASTENLLLNLMKEVKSLKEHIKVPSDNSLPVSQTGSSKSSKGNQGLLTSDPQNPLKSEFTKRTNMCKNVYAGLPKEMENLNEASVKELRSDNGTEFKNHKLEELCDEKGISQNFSSPCTLEQNGVAERRNRALIEAARTMDHLCEFDENADDGFFLGYSLLTKSFRGYNQHERIDYEETFAPVVRLEAIRISLAYTAYMDFMVYQMDVKSLFLNGKILEEMYQDNPKESHLVAVKRIFRYLKGTLNIGLWYSKGSGFDLKAYSDSDYGGCNMDRKSTSWDVKYLVES
nr:retrovirus-related Pol polyprotein from transposon TNT 1-94 [Tanacetum cinerariifolium]